LENLAKTQRVLDDEMAKRGGARKKKLERAIVFILFSFLVSFGLL